MNNKDKTLTTVRIDADLWADFKEICKSQKFTFQKLAERSIHLYITDSEFKNKIRNQQTIKPTL
jgi:hypothetical protein